MRYSRSAFNFNPRPPRGGRRCCRPPARGLLPISIHALREEGDRCKLRWRMAGAISIHALREEGDTSTRIPASTHTYFNPRPPRGGRLDDVRNPLKLRQISIHALREEGDNSCPDVAVDEVVISIHALREEGDGADFASRGGRGDFNPRPPRGGRLTPNRCPSSDVIFQSTPSARRATRKRRSILIPSTFQSTPSARRATRDDGHPPRRRWISIHALREEGDASAPHSTSTPRNFNPRPPRGGRPTIETTTETPKEISIHALREEGDDLHRQRARRGEISIHALREEGDSACSCGFSHGFYFNPRPPRGGRRSQRSGGEVSGQFQSTPSARRATGSYLIHL